MSLRKYDEKLARSIHDQLNCTGITENAIFPMEKEKENYRPKTLVDETLEYIDPTPNIHTLFVQFNEKFFWNVLLPVQVKWSPRMTSCAGICTFHPRNRECVISLSNPLLKLRPRKDLIETLLHEMIHAYLFLTNDNRDRDGHGPIFQSHMRRINKEAGTNITIYHSFHQEVRLYQQHWWRCNGPCQKRAPFFGTVRRSMNRAPGPNDFWWNVHQATCGGKFIKIKEPEKPEPKSKKKNDPKNQDANKAKASGTSGKNNIFNWVNKTDKTGNTQGKQIPKKPSDLFKFGGSSTKGNGSTLGQGVPKQPDQLQGSSWNNIKNNSVSNFQTDLKKLDNSTNNVYGWGTGGPNSTSSNNKFNTSNNIPSTSSYKNPRLSYSGTLGGNETGRSILLDKFVNTEKTNSLVQSNLNKSNSFNKSVKSTSTSNHIDLTALTVKCPSCNKSIKESKINEHLDICLESTEWSEVIPISSNEKRKSEDNHSTPNKIFKNENASTSEEVECPLCAKKLKPEIFNDHLDKCLQKDMDNEENDVLSVHDSSSSSVNLHDSPNHCLICDKPLAPGMSLNEHLEECVASVFNDSTDFSDEDFTESPKKTDKKEVLDEYPCPSCMILVKASLMNEHLDTCLSKAQWNEDL